MCVGGGGMCVCSNVHACYDSAFTVTSIFNNSDHVHKK